MGIDAARFRNDESLGIGIGNFANEMVALYVSHGNKPDDLLFTDDAIADYLLDMGPAAGISGGHVVAKGAPAPQEAFGPPLTAAGEVKMGCC